LCHEIRPGALFNPMDHPFLGDSRRREPRDAIGLPGKELRSSALP